ncbi:hypothetical protein DXG03_000028 [Asterophora parasitica]|uniref:Uncharacterized protein n=1 Tax=Asterophora parasitica TaxID=117018 RepID=A0A9P7GKI1_9AGAR|nr:hypothetical protein DXG03_000028 [Asterophora parasitica]
MALDHNDSAEFSLLDQDVDAETPMEHHDLSTAPLITREAYDLGGDTATSGQHGVLGRMLSTQ